ncbi:hypothetical protein [Pseudoduganella sp. OTU4001]|uniref:hypothetical protein n=1 Tax=Pseudoduganella sp. OTU4001 TaxID=3043854 RepID=UPI00313F0848
MSLNLSSSITQVKNTTPSSISPGVLALCHDIVRNGVPEYVSVQVENGAIVNECFGNVAKKVAADGGSIQHGWTIWQTGAWMVEGEFHAVWKAPDGTLIEVSPKPDGESSILFLPDPKLVFSGMARGSVRRALVRSLPVDDYVNLANKFEALGLAARAGTVRISREALMQLMECKDTALAMMAADGGADHPCACNSGKRYKNCHSKAAKSIRVL